MRSVHPQAFTIVGASFAGLAAALEISRLGHAVTVVERQAQIERQVCGEYLTPEGVEQMRLLGLEDLIARAPKIWGMQLVAPNASRVSCHFMRGRYGHAINRKEVLAGMLERALASGVQVLMGETLLGIDQVGERMVCRTDRSTLVSDYVIGADGRQSRTAHFLGGAANVRREMKRVAVHAYLRPRRSLEGQGQMHIFADGAYVGLNPTAVDEVNVSIVLSVEGLRSWASAKDCLNHYLLNSPGLVDVLPPVTDEEVRVSYPLGRRGGEVCFPRACLIGDAAGFIDPLTGEGITSALKTAVLLGEALASEPDAQLAFARYANARAERFREKDAINTCFQWLIQKPRLCDAVAFILSRSKFNRDVFISMVGNVLRPTEALALLAGPMKEKSNA